MPKMNINDECANGFRTEVSWGLGSYVQIATVNENSTLTLDGDSPGAAEPFDGWRVTLDRDGINRTIRALRKARDAAFGADA